MSVKGIRNINIGYDKRYTDTDNAYYEIYSSKPRERWTIYYPTHASIWRLQKLIDRHLVKIRCYTHGVTIVLELS